MLELSDIFFEHGRNEGGYSFKKLLCKDPFEDETLVDREAVVPREPRRLRKAKSINPIVLIRTLSELSGSNSSILEWCREYGLPLNRSHCAVSSIKTIIREFKALRKLLVMWDRGRFEGDMFSVTRPNGCSVCESDVERTIRVLTGSDRQPEKQELWTRISHDGSWREVPRGFDGRVLSLKEPRGVARALLWLDSKNKLEFQFGLKSITRSKGRRELKVRPPNLYKYIWLCVAVALHSNRPLRTCRICELPLEEGSKLFCGTADGSCKVIASRRRREYAISMLKDGHSPKVVFREVNSLDIGRVYEKTVERWHKELREQGELNGQ